MRKQKGFSLIELLIVVAIILIIAAIAVPNLLRSRMAANEASSAGALRTIATANVTYSSTYNVGFAPDLGSLGPNTAGSPADSTAADLIDSTLACASAPPAPPCTGDTVTVKGGYTFTYTPLVAAPVTSAPNGAFSVMSSPVASGSTGQSTFCVDQSNVVKKDTSGVEVATPADGCTGAWAAIPGL